MSDDLVVVRDACRAVIGRVHDDATVATWRATDVAPRGDLDFDEDDLGVDALGSRRTLDRYQLAEALLRGEVRGPTADAPLERLPETVYGWCPEHGVRAVARDDLVRAAGKARRTGRVQTVVVRRSITTELH